MYSCKFKVTFILGITSCFSSTGGLSVGVFSHVYFPGGMSGSSEVASTDSLSVCLIGSIGVLVNSGNSTGSNGCKRQNEYARKNDQHTQVLALQKVQKVEQNTWFHYITKVNISAAISLKMAENLP